MPEAVDQEGEHRHQDEEAGQRKDDRPSQRSRSAEPLGRRRALTLSARPSSLGSTTLSLRGPGEDARIALLETACPACGLVSSRAAAGRAPTGLGGPDPAGRSRRSRSTLWMVIGILFDRPVSDGRMRIAPRAEAIRAAPQATRPDAIRDLGRGLGRHRIGPIAVSMRSSVPAFRPAIRLLSPKNVATNRLSGR